jgi:hypothetical protein
MRRRKSLELTVRMKSNGRVVLSMIRCITTANTSDGKRSVMLKQISMAEGIVSSSTSFNSMWKHTFDCRLQSDSCLLLVQQHKQIRRQKLILHVLPHFVCGQQTPIGNKDDFPEDLPDHVAFRCFAAEYGYHPRQISIYLGLSPPRLAPFPQYRDRD